MDYDYNPFGGANEFDYYDSMSVKDAKRAVSRTSLGLFLFGAVSTAVLLVVYIILAIALGEDGYMSLVTNPYFYIPMGTLSMYVIGFPLFWLCIRALPTRRSHGAGSLTITELLAAIPIMQFAANIGASIGQGLDGVLGELFHTTSENPVDTLTEGVPVWLMITITVVIAPILEEFVFRKLILDRLSIYGNVFAIVMSAAMFGLFHGNLHQMFYAFFVGLIMGYVTVKGGSWLYGVGLHLFMNFVNGALPTILSEHFANYETAALAMLEGNGDAFAENFNSFMIAGSYIMITGMLSLVGAFVLVWAATKRLIYVKNSPEAIIPKGKMFAVVFANVGMLLFLLYTVFSIINQYILLI